MKLEEKIALLKEKIEKEKNETKTKVAVDNRARCSNVYYERRLNKATNVVVNQRTICKVLVLKGEMVCWRCEEKQRPKKRDTRSMSYGDFLKYHGVEE